MSVKSSFNPGRDIPDLDGKVILVTGGTGGLGKESIKELALHRPTRIFFTGRNASRGLTVMNETQKAVPGVTVEFVHCDHSSLKSVAQCARRIRSATPTLDLIMCNAGVMCLPAAVSKDGYEIQMATNHLAHALLLKLLLPTLQSAAALSRDPPRVVFLSSYAYILAPRQGVNFATLSTTQDGLGGPIPGAKWSRYGQSKLANLLYAREFARRYPELMTVAVHPGYVKTDLTTTYADFRTRMVLGMVAMGKWVEVEQGCHNQLWAATCPSAELTSGAYYEPHAQLINPSSKPAKDSSLPERLWEWTDQALASWT